MLQAQSLGGLGQPLWLIGFERRGLAFVDRAEAAGPRADSAQDHERGRLLRPTFHAIGAFGLFANRFQPQIGQHLGRAEVAVAQGHVLLEPAGQPTVGRDRQDRGIKIHDGQQFHASRSSGF